MTLSQSAGAEQPQGPPHSGELGRTGSGHDDAIRTLVIRLSRAHPSGGKVIERAAILASGADSEAVMSWIAAHAGQPETTGPVRAHRGLHAPRVAGADRPRRYVLPAGALD